MTDLEIQILKEFENCKEDVKKASPQLYYLLLQLKELGKLEGINFSKDLGNNYFKA